MREIGTDYLVVGAGASGMAFADTLVANTDAEVVLVDRRHRPGGHWLDAYPFVRLHQPSAYYGVESRPLGHDRIDAHGPNAGFYERASASEICDYYARVLDEHLLPTGRVQFFGMSDHRGGNGDSHLVVSLLDGSETLVKPRRKIVDATYVQSEIPSRHVPGFTVEPGVTLIPPNDLVDLGEPVDRFTVIGAGKTAIDTCVWLLEAGVEPDRIRWIRGRDPWQFDRTFTQPLDLVGGYMRLQARWVETAAAAEDGRDFARRLEDAGMFMRIDPSTEPLVFRGATVSRREVGALSAIEHVVRARRVRSIGRTTVATDAGDVSGGPREVYVDCTAAGVPASAPRPVFEPGRITIQYLTVGFIPWCAATIAVVESTGLDDEEKNGLCPPVVFSGDVDDLPRLAYTAMQGQAARARQETVTPWNAASRLNPGRAALDHIDDAGVADSLEFMREHMRDALNNLERTATVATQAR
ncbi:MAG TPA: NAD(P)-binding protein [Gaiellaceae bacterium]